jgi:hypothetical protein
VPTYGDRSGELVPFTRLHTGPDLYEREIERMVWKVLDTYSIEPPFLEARQTNISGDGVPEILTLDDFFAVKSRVDTERRLGSNLARRLQHAGS